MKRSRLDWMKAAWALYFGLALFALCVWALQGCGGHVEIDVREPLDCCQTSSSYSWPSGIVQMAYQCNRVPLPEEIPSNCVPEGQGYFCEEKSQMK